MGCMRAHGQVANVTNFIAHFLDFIVKYITARTRTRMVMIPYNPIMIRLMGIEGCYIMLSVDFDLRW